MDFYIVSIKCVKKFAIPLLRNTMRVHGWIYWVAHMTLADIFDFTIDDLTSNANGQLTTRQQATLQSYRKISRCGTIFAFIAVVGTISVMGAIVLFNTDVESSTMQQALPAIGIVFGLVLVSFIAFWLLGIYRSRYIRTPHVFEVTGSARPHLKKHPYRTLYTEYYVSIGKIRFQVTSKAQHDALQADKTYRAYYIHYPPTHIILSIEPLNH